MGYHLWIKRGRKFVKQASSPFGSKKRALHIARTVFKGRKFKITKTKEKRKKLSEIEKIVKRMSKSQKKHHLYHQPDSNVSKLIRKQMKG